MANTEVEKNQNQETDQNQTAENATAAPAPEKVGFFKRLTTWVKNNKGKAAGIGLGALTGAAVLAKVIVSKEAPDEAVDIPMPEEIPDPEVEVTTF